MNNKIVTEYNDTRECKVDIDEIVKQWTDLWFISQYHDEYRLVVIKPDRRFKSKTKIETKVTISKEQATDIITKLNLSGVKSSTFTYATTWVTRDVEQLYR